VILVADEELVQMIEAIAARRDGPLARFALETLSRY
jgi:hypothetical protein